MYDKRILTGCTLLGLVTGILITWFVSVQAGTTLEIWKNELFVEKLWSAWLVLVATIVLPTLVGLRTGLKRNDFSGILLTPVFAILAAAIALLAVGIVLIIMQNLQVYSFLGFVAIIGLLLPTTYSIIIIISG
ncbi:MAG: hypothetical protein IKU68_04640 [Oscillospiraceae bacterium]|nr:hypothetical protein [Oscillospiraceae bacterium]